MEQLKMPPLETERLIIRAFEEPDRALFHEINSDEKVMEFYPYRRTRAQSDEIFDKARAMLAQTGYGYTAVEIKATSECIGYCCLAIPELEPVLPKGTVEIGWRIAARYWGNGNVTKAAKALLVDGFTRRGLAEIVSFAVPANRRSLAVMERIGMERDESRDFDHPKISQDKAHLRRHVLYCLSKSQWEKQI
jgi:RimJ/RimL family protein N-acetyltransferase